MVLTRDTPTRVGVVGIGGIGSAYAEAVGAAGTLGLAAVCDTDAGRARRFERDTGIPTFTDCDEFLHEADCDVVVVATPPSLHASVTMRALSAGFDVLCEKPFALDADTARAMFARARGERRHLAMASKFRYVPDLDQAHRMIAVGRIGRPVTIHVSFASRVDMSDRWNSVPAVSGGGVLIDNGTHAVDIVRYLVGPIRRVSAMRGLCASGIEVEDTGVMLAETADRAIATVNVSWAIPPHDPHYVTVEGTDGTIQVGWSGSRVRSGPDGAWEEFGRGYAKLDALRANVENFAAARLGIEAMRISTSDVLASVEVIAATYRAIRTAAWVEVDEVAPDLARPAPVPDTPVYQPG